MQPFAPSRPFPGRIAVPAALVSLVLWPLGLSGQSGPGTTTQASTETPSASATETRRLLTREDYGKFESLGSASLSRNGRWLAAVVSRVDEDGEVRLQASSGDGETRVVENGTSFSFSEDGSWLGVTVQPPEKERERLRTEGEPVRNDLVVFATDGEGEERTGKVRSFDFSPDSRYLLMRRYGPDGNEAGGADVVIRDLATGADLNFGNVAEARWADDGALVAMVVDAEDRAGNGVRLYDASTGRLRMLHTADARFSGLTWREDGRDLAVFQVEPDTVRGDTLFHVLAWRNVGSDEGALHRLEAELTGGDGEALRVTDRRGIRWAEDGDRLFFAVQARSEKDEAKEAEAEGEEAEAAEEGSVDEAADGPGAGESEQAPGVEIWHARDVDPIPQQRLRADGERRRSDLAGWALSGEPVILGGRGLEENVTLLPGERGAVLSDDGPHARDRMFGPLYRDYYLVDVATGERTLALERVEHYRGVSPGGRYLLFFRDDHFHVYDAERHETRNLTTEVPATFTNERVDVVTPQKPPHGVGGWTEDDRHVLLYDAYDVWRVRPDGSGGERVTRGAEEDVRHRLVFRNLDPDEDAFPEDGPWWVTLYGEWTKRSGYGRVAPGGEVERLVWEDRSVQRLMRSDDESTYGFLTQRYDEPPVLHAADADLRDRRAVLATNDFADDYLWGRAELVDYENEWGERLQGALFYPADYEPGRRYPMIVYHYERRSQILHFWTNPSERSAYNTTVFTQNGYFVLQPDIVYRPRNPGLSFMEAVLPAVDAVVATGMIDEDRIGITGHSWGGYQTTFAVTQTDRFAAAVAGAPLTNLVSMYLSFYWNTGGTDARIFEISQGRMEVPWWEDFDSYRANSPVHHIQAMNTPLLMAFGDEDGAVEFNQGVEFYNAARRAGKDFVLLVYEGENHSLQKKPNQIDYHRRTLEWFNHYLKGAEAPAWITDGVRWVEQQEKLERGPAAGRVPGTVSPAVDSEQGG